MANQTNTIPKGWKKTTLGEVVNFSQGLQISTDDQSVKKKEGYIRFVRIVDYTNEGEIPRYIKNPGRCFVNKDDLVMIRYGSQTAGKIMRGISGVIANNTFKITPNESLDNKWLYWFLRQDSIYQYLNKDQSSSTMPAITFTQVGNIEIPILSLPEQRAIAAVLSSFDDKIELLREQNKTLEATAQAIFKEWFVKFNFPGATGKMIDSELGKIPEGWRAGRLAELGQIICGKTPSKENKAFFGGNIPFIKIPDMHGEIFIVQTEDSLTELGANTQKNKFIPKNSICVSCIATVGLVSITSERSQSNQQINSIIPNHENYLEYFYFILCGMKEDLIAMGSGGSATLNINTTTFSNIKIIIPLSNAIDNFHQLTNSMFVKILENLHQIQTLSTLRDTLLPKLMEGEIRVKF